MRSVWFLLGSLSIVIGAVGIILPLLPTVPFLLLSAFCFSKSSDKAHTWLITHNVFGPPILNWQERGAIRRPVKYLASFSILAVFCITFFSGVVWWGLLLQAAVLICVSIFIWTRPEA